jgi:hypothetical protein
MRSALDTLELSYLTLVYPGKDAFPLADNALVKPLTAFA